jgi:hypothetical protein
MNERIRELVRQAVITVDIVTGNEALDDELAKMYIPDCFSEKFAELIVAECIEQLNIPNVPTPISAGLNLGRVAIKEHFGVKE